MSWDDCKYTEGKLIGKPVQSIEKTNREEVTITFMDGSRLVGATYGDCCADAYVDEVAGSYVIGGPFRGVKQIIYAEGPYEKETWGYTDVFVQIATIGTADVVILCKCEHSGYYSGWLEWSEEGPLPEDGAEPAKEESVTIPFSLFNPATGKLNPLPEGWVSFV